MAENNDASPPAPAKRRRWDVFLSFRGEDTRHGFTDRLYEALNAAQVRAFRDNEGMSKGDVIASSLIDAIHDSTAAIAVISPSYASSRWCLEELATICECRRLLLPVFFNVDPSHVRRQKGPFEEDFRSLESRFEEKEVVRWRDAMGKAGGISGWVYQNRYFLLHSLHFNQGFRYRPLIAITVFNLESDPLQAVDWRKPSKSGSYIEKINDSDLFKDSSLRVDPKILDNYW